MSADKLTPKQRAFANAIVSGMNPSDAYAHAGYSMRGSAATVAREAQRLLSHPTISLIIEEGRESAAKGAQWSRRMALERLFAVNSIAYSDIRENGLTSSLAASSFFKSTELLNEMVHGGDDKAVCIVLGVEPKRYG